MLSLAAICVRNGVAEAVANRALVKAHPWPEDGPWASQVTIDGQVLVVGQDTDPTQFYCFPCPFDGNPGLDLPAFRSAEDFLVLIGGPQRSELQRT